MATTTIIKAARERRVRFKLLKDSPINRIKTASPRLQSERHSPILFQPCPHGTSLLDSVRLASYGMTTVLLASDADWLIEEVRSALSDPGTTVNVVRAGADVRALVSSQIPDLVILDLQIGNMGGMATCMDLRLEIDAERLPPVPILMLLDREADVYLAQQAGAQGWLVKPLNSFRLKMAAVALLAGEDMREEATSAAEPLSESVSPDEIEVDSDTAESSDVEEAPQVT